MPPRQTVRWIGFFLPVTLLDNPPDNLPFVTEEVFGPIRSVFKYKDLDEAIGRANDTSYGLGTSVWGTDPEELRKVAGRLEPGTLWINRHARVSMTNRSYSGCSRFALFS